MLNSLEMTKLILEDVKEELEQGGYYTSPYGQYLTVDSLRRKVFNIPNKSIEEFQRELAGNYQNA